MRVESVRDLGELQAAVLEIVWQLGQGTVAEVQAQFPEERKPAYTTVLTVLRSLEKRGLLQHTQRERTYIYLPAVAAEKVRAGALQVLMQRMFGGSGSRLVATLLEEAPLSADELSRIRRLVDSQQGAAAG